MPLNRSEKICIGFPRLKKVQGPKIFLSRLKREIEQQALAKTSSFLLPFFDVGIFTSIARSYYGKPYILRLDGIYFDKKETRGSNIKKNKPIFESIDKAAGVIYQSEFNKKLIEIFKGNQKEPFCIIPNGVDTTEFSPDGNDHRERLGIKKNERVLITSASWRPHKRLDDVLEIFTKLDKYGDIPYHLIILGNPEKKLPDNSRIHCPGFLSPDNLQEWYRTGDVFVFLSWIDHCPNTVIEAIACGLPVVCTNQGGTREIIQRTSGGIVAEADEDFLFKEVDLYNPPKPDHEKIIAAILNVFENYDKFRNSIRYDEINIKNIAAKYVSFIKQSVTGS